MAQTPLFNIAQSPYIAPQSLACALLPNVTSAPYEGLWVPVGYCKSLQMETFGSMSTISMSLYGSNSPGTPLNTYTITVGGSSFINLDTESISFSAQTIGGNPIKITYVSSGSDTTSTIAAGLAALINANATLQGLGVNAAAAANVITISFPSIAPGPVPGEVAGFNYPSSAGGGGIANSIAITTAITGTGNETLTVTTPATFGTLIGAAITAFGITSITAPWVWLKMRLNTLTGGGANVTANLAGVI